MDSIVTTTLSFFKMSNIKPNFSELTKQFSIARHTLKKILKQADSNKERKESMKAIMLNIDIS